MKVCEILSVGTELLLGDVVDTNAAWLSRGFREAGFSVLHRQTCGDNWGRLADSLRLALSRSDVVMVTGGLGPTYDDITREVTAEVLGLKLKSDPQVEEKLRGFFLRRGMKMSENNLRQAMVPEGAVVLENDWGTAPGLWVEEKDKTVILLPGVPREMKQLFCHRVLPRLKEISGLTLVTQIFKLYGISESALDQALGETMRASCNPTVAPYAGNGEVELHITASAQSTEEAEGMCEKMKEEILPVIRPFCYGREDENLEIALVRRFVKQGLTVATAESCTGGLISQRITSVPDSSRIFSLGICSYSEEQKMRLLGVKSETLKQEGVYSSACALEMARGVRSLAGSDVGIGVTGIAGPGGGNDRDPVGTVYIAVVTHEKEMVERFVFGHQNPTREEVRNQAASKALAMTMQSCDLFCQYP